MLWDKAKVEMKWWLCTWLRHTACHQWYTVCCEAWAINRSDIRTLDIAWNNAFRKTFNGFWRECQTTVILLPISVLLPMRKLLFGEKCFTVITCY